MNFRRCINTSLQTIQSEMEHLSSFEYYIAATSIDQAMHAEGGEIPNRESRDFFPVSPLGTAPNLAHNSETRMEWLTWQERPLRRRVVGSNPNSGPNARGPSVSSGSGGNSHPSGWRGRRKTPASRYEEQRAESSSGVSLLRRWDGRRTISTHPPASPEIPGLRENGQTGKCVPSVGLHTEIPSSLSHRGRPSPPERHKPG